MACEHCEVEGSPLCLFFLLISTKTNMQLCHTMTGSHFSHQSYHVFFPLFLLTSTLPMIRQRSRSWRLGATSESVLVSTKGKNTRLNCWVIFPTVFLAFLLLRQESSSIKDVAQPLSQQLWKRQEFADWWSDRCLFNSPSGMGWCLLAHITMLVRGVVSWSLAERQTESADKLLPLINIRAV